MTPSDLQTIGVIIALLVSAFGLYRDFRKLPADMRSSDIDASASAAAALKSYSDEVLKLRAELANMRAEIAQLRRERDQSLKTLDEWQDGIRRLVAQLVSINHTPVWQPEQRK